MKVTGLFQSFERNFHVLNFTSKYQELKVHLIPFVFFFVQFLRGNLVEIKFICLAKPTTGQIFAYFIIAEILLRNDAS